MLEAQIVEGTLRLDDNRIVIVHNMSSGFLNLLIYSVLGKLFNIEDEILFKDMLIVSVEKGKPGVMCPHLYIRYIKNKQERSRIIEFPVERSGKKCDIDKVIDFLDKRKVQLGIMRNDD